METNRKVFDSAGDTMHKMLTEYDVLATLQGSTIGFCDFHMRANNIIHIQLISAAPVVCESACSKKATYFTEHNCSVVLART
jgi:hypothetical protein